MKDTKEQTTLITVPSPFFGGCPICGRNNGVVQIYQGDWGVCHVHRKIWLASTSLWATGTDLTREQWDEIARRFESYEEVETVGYFDADGKLTERIREPGIHCGLPNSVKEAMGRLVAHVWATEADNYYQLSESESADHVFRLAAIVDGWMNGLDERDEDACEISNEHLHD